MPLTDAQLTEVQSILSDHSGVDTSEFVESDELQTYFDALDRVELAMAFEEAFDIELPDSEMVDPSTFADLYTLLASKLAA